MNRSTHLMRLSSAALVWALSGFLLTGLPSVSAQQNIRGELFAEADDAMAQANDAEANILAPASYESAAELYRRAEENLTRGRALADIREDLAEAVRLFERATERTELARVSLTEAVQARQDAFAAEAPQYSADLWQDAEETFATAVRRLEAGNMNRARSAAADAEEEFRAAELTAIENNYLSAARSLIQQAKRDRVDRAAPITLARAESLLAEAEEALRRDRYDTDYPRSLAREARYEAQHSMHIAGLVRAVDDRQLTMEELLKQVEEPFTRIAGELDQIAELDQGFASTTESVIEAIQILQADQETLRQRGEQIAFLEGEMASLEARLGEESEQRKIQEQVQQRFERIASVFTPEEAQVLRRGDEVIVRMGLNFDSGSSVIKPQYFSLLRKIQTAIDVFPSSGVEVQGHTDSFGADEFNRQLSQERADAVRQYLLANMTLGSTSVEAMGYGETVPLANNETPEGRTKNRRIDLLIRPNLNMLVSALSED